MTSQDVIVHFNFFPEFTIRPVEQTEKDCPVAELVADVQGQSISTTANEMADEIGGAGGN